MQVTAKNKTLSVTAYAGDAKTLLAFNLPKSATNNLAGFTIQCQPDGQPSYYLQNNLQFKDPSAHHQDSKLPAASSFNAPFHKFRWLHVPGSLHQGLEPFYGRYTYCVTPRYFDNGSLTPINPALSVSVSLNVGPFVKDRLALGFTRGYIQSQAFVHHFGPRVTIRPKDTQLLFNTTQVAGRNPAGQSYSFDDEYGWLGFTARQKLFGVVEEVLDDNDLQLDVFAYDLNEPNILKAFLKLATQGRIRVILDNAPLHHNLHKTTPEDDFTKQFENVAKGQAAILRGKFGRFAHDKVLIVSKGFRNKKLRPTKVLSGSTNFSITGLYVNANHIIVFDDSNIAETYEAVFQESWQDKASKVFYKSQEAKQSYTFTLPSIGKTTITFSPHAPDMAAKILDEISARVKQEQRQQRGSVLFAVMQLSGGGSVFPTLQKLHANQRIFSYGISDSPGGIYLYDIGKDTGVLVSGKPGSTSLPPPFDQVPSPPGHEIHHKFVVCGFNGPNPVAYLGSSNLALGGEENNGDNLISIQDRDVTTAFSIEALALVDHYSFLDRYASKAKRPRKKVQMKSASKQALALSASWYLSTNDKWASPYYAENDLHCKDRQLFSGA